MESFHFLKPINKAASDLSFFGDLQEVNCSISLLILALAVTSNIIVIVKLGITAWYQMKVRLHYLMLHFIKNKTILPLPHFSLNDLQSYYLSSSGHCLVKVRKFISIIVKLGSCSSLLKFLYSTLKVSIQKQKEQSWCYNHNATTHQLTNNVSVGIATKHLAVFVR